MRRLILILSFIPYFSFSQVNTFIVDTTKTWSVLIGEYPFSGSRQSTHTYKFQGDTTVNEKLFKKVYETTDSTEQVWGFSNKLVREESGNVYLNSNGSEDLIYNFNITKGETISLLNMFGETNDWVVDTIDSVEVSGTLLKRITLKLHDYLTDYWIEGIGSTLGIIYSGNFVIDFSTNLLCATQQNLTIFNNPEYNDCYIFTGIRTPSISNIKIYPTLVYDNLYVESVIYPLKFSITDIAGRVLIKDNHCCPVKK
jgi:hypothetical protein